MTPDELQLKAAEYKTKLEQIKGERQEAERQLILLEEQYKQYKAKIEESFGTSEPEKLMEITEQYLITIKELEVKLND